MALISCPECKQEISDQSKACPHCGYPFNDIAQKNTESLPVVPVVPKQKNMKATVLVAMGIILVLVAGFFAVQAIQTQKLEKQREEYIAGLKEIQGAMFAGALGAEELGNLTSAVWSNTIYEKRDPETDIYTKNPNFGTISGAFGFNKDFNDSLQRLFKAESTQAKVQALKKNQSTVESLYASLQNPPKGMEKHYELMDAAFNDYQKFIGLAISPKGSLNTFTAELRKYDTDLIDKYTKLNLLLKNKDS